MPVEAIGWASGRKAKEQQESTSASSPKQPGSGASPTPLCRRRPCWRTAHAQHPSGGGGPPASNPQTPPLPLGQGGASSVAPGDWTLRSGPRASRFAPPSTPQRRRALAEASAVPGAARQRAPRAPRVGPAPPPCAAPPPASRLLLSSPGAQQLGIRASRPWRSLGVCARKSS